METSTDEMPTLPATIAVTPRAAIKIAEFLELQGKPSYLRIAVQPGGCSGLKYALYFDNRDLDGDVVTEIDSVAIRVDRLSAPYLRGASVDWLDGLEKSGFTIDNPNAAGSCACGDSFH